MKVRDSGMPDKDMWEGFFFPAKILEILELGDSVRNVVEFGCGYGTFTIPAAKIIKGKIYALDIDPNMINATREEAKKHKLRNIDLIQRDFLSEGSGLPDESTDYVMLFNILHLEKPIDLLLEANRILKIGGKVGIVHWNYDSATPRGPSMDIRPKPEHCIQWIKKTSFINPKQFELEPYHYGIVATKEKEEI